MCDVMGITDSIRAIPLVSGMPVLRMSSMVLIIFTSPSSISMGTLSAYSVLGTFSAVIDSVISLILRASGLPSSWSSRDIWLHPRSRTGLSRASMAAMAPCSYMDVVMKVGRRLLM